MLSGLLFPGLAATLAVAPEADGSRPLNEWQIEQVADCGEEGETSEQLLSRSAIVNADGMVSPVTLKAAIEAAGEGRLIVVQGDFTGQDMREVAPLLSGSCLAATKLDQTDWADTAISDLRLERVGMTGIKASGVRWTKLQARGVNFAGSDFTGANLAGLRFVSLYQGADFGEVSFRDANLADASFHCGMTVDAWCINAGPDLRGAIVEGADLSGLGLWDEAMNVGAVLDRTTIAPRSLRYLAGARFDGPIILAAEFGNAYGGERGGPTAELTATEARTLMEATRIDQAQGDGDRPSFDCDKAVQPVEILICGEYEYELRALDRELNEVWRKVVSIGKADLPAQRQWLRSRSQCADRTCLAERYELRIGKLRGKLGPGITLAPEQSITYLGDALPLPDALRTGELYERILPVLKDASHQTVILTGLEDGSISAEGDAIGTNAHMCSLLIDSARFDLATGWWSAEGTSGKVPLFRVDGRRLVLRYSGNLGNTPEEALDFMSCGARAYFDDGFDLSPG